MNKNSSKIDSYIRKKKNKIIFITLSLVIFLSVFFGLLVAPPMGKVSQVNGQVLRLTGMPTDYGNILLLLVKLENGKEIRIRIEDSSYYKQGKTIILYKQEPLLYGTTSYTFKEYVK